MTQLPPVWKIWREAKRLVRKVLILPLETARILYFRHWYDFSKPARIKVSSGALEIGREIAIYLIFPNSGLLELHKIAIDEMLKSGITPVIVSNFPLKEADRIFLLSKSAWVMERPNIGYDFGGYRDAILALQKKFENLERLWIVNDSTILVRQEINWFEAARALNVDFAAATSNFGIPRTSLKDFRSIKWCFATTHKNFHYASYAWSIGPLILKDPYFVEFWKKLEIRNDKSRTVRRGEIGFSQWVISRKYSHRATWEIDGLETELKALDDREIVKIAREVQILDDSRLGVLKKKIVGADPVSQDAVKDCFNFILYAVARQASVYAIPKYGIKHRGFQFIKRSLKIAPES